jgi:hypothetical protein
MAEVTRGAGLTSRTGLTIMPIPSTAVAGPIDRHPEDAHGQ